MRDKTRELMDMGALPKDPNLRTFSKTSQIFLSLNIVLRRLSQSQICCSPSQQNVACSCATCQGLVKMTPCHISQDINLIVLTGHDTVNMLEQV